MAIAGRKGEAMNATRQRSETQPALTAREFVARYVAPKQARLVRMDIEYTDGIDGPGHFGDLPE